MNSWKPEINSIPSYHFGSICKFDYNSQSEIAQKYYEKDLPFIIYNHPDVNQAILNWKNFNYLNSLFGKNTLYFSEFSKNDQQYYNNKNNPSSKVQYLTFEEWIEFAIKNYFQNEPQHINNESISEIDLITEVLHHKVIERKIQRQKRITGYKTLYSGGGGVGIEEIKTKLLNEFPFLKSNSPLFHSTNSNNQNNHERIQCRFGKF